MKKVLKIHLLKIIKLVGKTNAQMNEIEDDEITLNIDDILNETPEELLLTNYMRLLDVDTVLDIETIMYIGRDYVEDENSTVDIAFKNLRGHLKMVSDNDKDIMIEQIIGKMPLAKYLKDGMRKMNI